MTQSSASLTSRSLLVELVTEELPPKALKQLGLAFADGIRSALEKKHLLESGTVAVDFATPRRLAVLLTAVRQQAPELAYTEKLMPARVGLTADDQATPALVKKLGSLGLQHLSPADLLRQSDGKQDFLYATGVAPGATLTQALQDALDHTIAHLPIPKVMQYQLADGVTTVKFVRPAHGLVALWGNDVVPVNVLGLAADRITSGHRFMGEQTLRLNDAGDYENVLATRGKVTVSFEKRKQQIWSALESHAHQLSASLGTDPEVAELLNEVTALVEHSTVYAGQFDPQFLDVPAECLILTMRQNQRYFPLFEPDSGKLTHHFLIVSNMRLDDPTNIIQGNERVVRPRLADARFFFDADRKVPLEDRVASLADSVYHNQLGSQRDRVERIRQIARYVAAQLGADTTQADRAALLAKADLNSNMVAEFPELQGVIGAYYAQADGEPDSVVQALGGQYRIRLTEPVIAQTLVAATLFIAERAEILIGIWGIGLAPTGERDPYGLRRAALGIISAYQQLGAGGYLATPDSKTLALEPLLHQAAATFDQQSLPVNTASDVLMFIYERYRNLLTHEHDRTVIDAVLALHPPLHEVSARIKACSLFARQPQATSLASANKRISNLLRKADNINRQVNPELFAETAEKALYEAIVRLEPDAQAQYEAGEFTASLATLAQVRDPVDDFFNDVMIMTDDLDIRENRLALLQRLHQTMNRVADLARLAQ